MLIGPDVGPNRWLGLFQVFPMHLKERQPLPSGHIHGNMESQSENKINSSHKGEDESQQSPGQFVCLLLIVPEAENKIPTIITLDC